MMFEVKIGPVTVEVSLGCEAIEAIGEALAANSFVIAALDEAISRAGDEALAAYYKKG